MSREGSWVTAVAVIAFLFCQSQFSFAYVPPSEFLVKSSVAKRAGLKSLKWVGTVSAVEKGVAHGPKFKDSTWIDLSGGVIRSVALNEAGEVLFRMERNFRTKEKEKEIPLLLAAVLFESRSNLLIEALSSVGLPIKTEAELLTLENEEKRREVEQTSLSRLQLQGSTGGPSKTIFSWIIGGPEQPQLWFEKDTFLPIRLLGFPGWKKGDEIRVEDYRTVRDFSIPRVISLWSGFGSTQEPVLMVELREASVNPADSVSKPFRELGMTEAANRETAEIRRLLQNYYQTLR